jgi:ABC-type uncharacterized transport system substrate-binding protein
LDFGLTIFDYGEKMRKKSPTRFAFLCSGTRKSKIENPIWVGIFALIIAFAFGAVMAEAQQPTKISRIGFLAASSDSSDAGPLVEAFRQGLRDLGYVEGKNIRVVYRYAEGKLDRMANLLTELVQLNVDVIVVQTLFGIRAAREATKTIPICDCNRRRSGCQRHHR